MSHSFADSLDVLATPYLAPSLVDGAAYARLLRTASRFPARMANWAHIECRLGAGENQVDLIPRVDGRGCDVLADVDPFEAVDPAAWSGWEWSRVRELARWWRTQEDAQRAIANLWLEFDVPTASTDGELPQPGLFVEFASNLYRVAGAAATAEMGLDALDVLLDRPVSNGTAATLRRLASSLPNGASLYSIGMLLPRGDRVVRICLMDVPDDALVPYLMAAGWAGSASGLRALIEPLTVAMDCAAERPAIGIVHLDIAETFGDAIGPRIGFEYVLDRAAQLRGQFREQAFLDHLVALGLCTPEKRAGLDQWPGAERRTMAHDLWPSAAIRRVNHVKVTAATDGAPSAKAYLCCNHEPWHAHVPRSPRRSLATSGRAPQLV